MGETVLDQGTAAGDGLGRRPPIDHPPARPPQIGDYAERRAAFTWDEARGWLDGLPDGRLNIAHEAVDRHAHGPLADVVALRFLSRTSPTTELTYAALARETDTVAVALGLMGIARGDRVCALLAALPRALPHRARRPQGRRGLLPAVPRVRHGPGAPAPRARRRARAASPTASPLPARSLRCARSSPRWRPCWWSTHRRGTAHGDGGVGHDDGRGGRRPRPRRVHHRRHRARTTRRCCTSRAGPRARRRVRCTSTRPSSRTMPPPGSPSTCTPTTSTGAPPTPAG